MAYPFIYLHNASALHFYGDIAISPGDFVSKGFRRLKASQTIKASQSVFLRIFNE